MADFKSTLRSLKEGETYDDSSDKTTFPELKLKSNIIDAQENLLISERILMSNFRLYRKFDKSSLIAFEGNLILLFSFIKVMVEDRGFKGQESLYRDLELLERGKSFKVSRLFDLKNFLLKQLHSLNLTNLFTGKGGDPKNNIRESMN